MRRRDTINLLGIAIGWAVLWVVLHFMRPATFPWAGVPAGFLVVAPFFINAWLERRKARQQSKRSQRDSAD